MLPRFFPGPSRPLRPWPADFGTVRPGARRIILVYQRHRAGRTASVWWANKGHDHPDVTM